MKKVLIVYFHQFPWDVRIDKIAKSLLSNDFEVHVLCRWFDEALESEMFNGLHIKRHGFKKSALIKSPIPRSPFWKSSIKEYAQEIKPDLILVRDMHLADVSSQVAKEIGVPIIMDMAEHYPAAMREWKDYNSNLIKKIAVHNLKIPDKIESYAVRNMDGIIVVCDEQQKRLNREYGFDFSNIVTVYNSSESFFANEKTFTDEITFGHHGHLTSEKSLEVFIKGFLLAAEKMPNIKLHLYGEGHSLSDYKQIVSNSNYGDRVHFAGKYNFKNLPEILNSFTIGVIPYQISDFNNYTIHNKIFDYMASATPVLVSEMKPTMRLVNESQCGIATDLSTPHKVENAILNYPYKKLKYFSENAFNSSKTKYNWKIDESKLLNFINKFLSK